MASCMAKSSSLSIRCVMTTAQGHSQSISPRGSGKILRSRTLPGLTWSVSTWRYMTWRSPPHWMHWRLSFRKPVCRTCPSSRSSPTNPKRPTSSRLPLPKAVTCRRTFILTWAFLRSLGSTKQPKVKQPSMCIASTPTRGRKHALFPTTRSGRTGNGNSLPHPCRSTSWIDLPITRMLPWWWLKARRRPTLPWHCFPTTLAPPRPAAAVMH